MSAQRFFDDLARTLAEPMPRRRAVRVIGASLAAIAIPGVSPRMARAATQSGSQHPVCARGELCCTQVDANGKVLQHNPCGYPIQRYQCVNYKCSDTCPPKNRVLKNPDGTPKRQEATWSGDEYADGRPKRYNCCQVPDSLPRDGECLPNCVLTHGPGAHRCKDGCCPRSQRCLRSTGQCEGCPPNRPIVCGSECCDRSEEVCLEVSSAQSSGVRRRQCVEKCAPGKRRCIGSDGELGECCPERYPCCGTSCGCDGRTECVSGSLERGVKKMCRPKCVAPGRRCNLVCCTPDRMYQDRHPDGRRYCRCRP